MRKIFPENQFQKEHCEGIATLWVDNTSLGSDYPIFFAESYPSSTTLFTAGTLSCHKVERFPLQCAESTMMHNIYNLLHAHLFCPFIDVLCVFTDNFGDVKNVILLLKAWAAAGNRPCLSQLVRPRVVIVKCGSNVISRMNLSFSVPVLELAAEEMSPLTHF